MVHTSEYVTPSCDTTRRDLSHQPTPVVCPLPPFSGSGISNSFTRHRPGTHARAQLPLESPSAPPPPRSSYEIDPPRLPIPSDSSPIIRDVRSGYSPLSPGGTTRMSLMSTGRPYRDHRALGRRPLCLGSCAWSGGRKTCWPSSLSVPGFLAWFWCYFAVRVTLLAPW